MSPDTLAADTLAADTLAAAPRGIERRPIVRIRYVTPGSQPGLLIVLSAVLLASVTIPPFLDTPLGLCLIRFFLGIPGPGCGMTRAFLFIGHGDLLTAWQLNPNSVPVFALVAALWVNEALRFFAGRAVTVTPPVALRRALYGVTLLLMAFAWIYNVLWNPWM